jgi:hypothetical protein
MDLQIIQHNIVYTSSIEGPWAKNILGIGNSRRSQIVPCAMTNKKVNGHPCFV